MRERLPACRSILFVPGDRPDRYEKALAAGADAICIDLEDAVAPPRKPGARAAAAHFLAGRASNPSRPSPSPVGSDPPAASRQGIIVRVNALETHEGERDAATLAGDSRPDAFMLPKVTTDDDVHRAHRLLSEDVPVLPIIETALGLENAARIGAASRAVVALVFGGFDLSAELGAEPRWEPLLYARSRVVHAAALSGLDAIDMPSRDLREMTGLRAEAAKARNLGYTGKAAIHPAQIPAIHEVFTPSRAELRQALKVLEADRAAGGGAVALDGKMVDRPVVEAARRTIERAHPPR